MGFTSAWHWVIVLLVVMIVFGAGKLPKVMGDVAKGIKNFKSGLKDEDETPAVTSSAPSSATTARSADPIELDRHTTGSRPTAS